MKRRWIGISLMFVVCSGCAIQQGAPPSRPSYVIGPGDTAGLQSLQRMDFMRYGPPQYVIVTFPDERDVYVDGKVSGITNTIMILPAGTYEFTLGEPGNYRSPEQPVTIKDTTRWNPTTIAFEEIDDES